MDESNIPIDINIGKLQDWLVSRRHVSKEWQKAILGIREKINNAIQDMPAHDGIASLLSGTYINYFHCQKIIEILKETEADTRNLFGRYGSQRMKDWQEILRCYEKDNLYLAEAAQMLCRNINYEIPSLKKQIVKEEQLQIESRKKQADYLKKEASNKAEFLTLCKQLGIKGDKIKQELVNRCKKLPSIYDEIESSLESLNPAIKLYSVFINYMHVGESSQVLPLLQYIIKKGNTTVYEWSYGEAPLRLEPDTFHVELDEEKNVGDQINFNAIKSAADFDEDFYVNEGDHIDYGEFDFNVDIDSAADVVNFGDNNEDDYIDWGDDIVPQGVSSGIVVKDQGESSKVAKGRYALKLLDNPSTRDEFIDELVELESFLKMRLYEKSGSSDVQTFSLLHELPSESTKSLTSMLNAVQAALSNMTSSDITHLHNVKHSPEYLDVLTAQLEQKLSLCAKMSKLASQASERMSQAAEREVTLRPLLSKIIDNMKQLQADIERDISKKYKGRPVNIIGGVKYL